MEPAPDNTILTLMRAELDGALSRLEVRLIDRFASKQDTEAIHDRVTKYQEIVAQRFEKVEERFGTVGDSISSLVAWRNRIVGALALIVFVIPLVVTLLAYRATIFG